MKIETERLILRDLKKTDIKDLHKNVNDKQIAKSIPVIKYPYIRKYAVDFVNSCIKESGKKQRAKYEFCICLKSDNKLIGMIGISKVDRFHGTCTIGYWIGKDYRRQGIMSEALDRVIKFVFKTLKLRRIDITALGDNTASNELIKKKGFIYEGTRKECVRDWATKRLHDRIDYGILKKNWIK
ncbi:MAG: GNAT family protein [Nanoarchaeota archaeon]